MSYEKSMRESVIIILEDQHLQIKCRDRGITGPPQKKMQSIRRECDKCMRFLSIQRQPSQVLTMVSNPWPFVKWKIDLIGSRPKERENVNFTIVAIGYFNMWVEAEPLSKITKADTSKFI